MADDAAVLLIDTRQEARNIDEVDERNVERMKREDLQEASTSRQPAMTFGSFAMMPTARPSKRAKQQMMFFA